jgi:hypothetical protein
MQMQREKLSKKKETTSMFVEEKRRQQMRQSLDDLKRKLESPGINELQKTKLEEKMQKISAQLTL